MKEEPISPLKIFFPVDAQSIDWEEYRAENKAGKRTDLLTRQHTFIENKKNGPRRFPYCSCCEQAQFTVRFNEEKSEYSLARMPNSAARHIPSCAGHGQTRLDQRLGSQQSAGKIVGKDFKAVLQPLADPEDREVREPTSRATRSRGDTRSHKGKKSSTSLRRFGKELLQGAGVCDWHPRLEGRRDQRVVNGLIAGAVAKIRVDARWDELMTELGSVRVVPWSYYRSDLSTARSISIPEAVVAFGFLESLSDPTLKKSRIATFSGSPTGVILSAALLADAARNEEQPLLEGLPPFPVWCLFVARMHGGVWKAHTFECFRVTQHGAIPVSSDNEEIFVEYLMKHCRHFRRWVIPKPGSPHIPDFELLDIEPTKYVEVAGLTNNKKYMRDLGEKIRRYACLVWYTNLPLAALVLPPPTKF